MTDGNIKEIDEIVTEINMRIERQDKKKIRKQMASAIDCLIAGI